MSTEPQSSRSGVPTPTEALRLAGYGKLADLFPPSEHASLLLDIQRDEDDIERGEWDDFSDD